MSLQQLQGVTTQNGPMFLGNGMFQPGPGMPLGQPLGPYDQHPGFGNTGNLLGLHRIPGILQPSPPSVSPIGGGGGLASIEGGFNNRLPRPPHYASPMPVRPDFGFRPGPIMGLQPAMPDYSSQFEKFGEQLTGFGDQMTGYQDALGSFNEQVGGMGKQFETINNRLDSVDKGLGSLGNQIASFENMQKAQPQEVMQPQRPTFNPFGFGGFGGFGGLGSLFGRRY
jgi:hypothetical protein